MTKQSWRNLNCGDSRSAAKSASSAAPVKLLCGRLAHAAFYRRVVCRFPARFLPRFAGEHFIMESVIVQLAVFADVAEVWLHFHRHLSVTIFRQLPALSQFAHSFWALHPA